MKRTVVPKFFLLPQLCPTVSRSVLCLTGGRERGEKDEKKTKKTIWWRRSWWWWRVEREREKLQLSKLSAVTVAIWSWCAITFHHHDPHAHKVLISWWKKLWVRDGITSLHAMSDTNEVINRIISRLETSGTKDGESSPHVTRLSALVHFAYCCLVTGCCSCSTTN